MNDGHCGRRVNHLDRGNRDDIIMAIDAHLDAILASLPPDPGRLDVYKAMLDGLKDTIRPFLIDPNEPLEISEIDRWTRSLLCSAVQRLAAKGVR